MRKEHPETESMTAAMAHLETSVNLTATDDMVHKVATEANEKIKSGESLKDVIRGIADLTGAAFVTGDTSRPIKELDRAVLHLDKELDRRSSTILDVCEADKYHDGPAHNILCLYMLDITVAIRGSATVDLVVLDDKNRRETTPYTIMESKRFAYQNNAGRTIRAVARNMEPGSRVIVNMERCR